jgi:hypothetical protein
MFNPTETYTEHCVNGITHNFESGAFITSVAMNIIETSKIAAMVASVVSIMYDECVVARGFMCVAAACAFVAAYR